MIADSPRHGVAAGATRASLRANRILPCWPARQRFSVNHARVSANAQRIGSLADHGRLDRLDVGAVEADAVSDPLFGDDFDWHPPEPHHRSHSACFQSQARLHTHVAELFGAIGDLASVSRTYDAMLALENGYRGSSFTREAALIDTRDAAFALASRELKGIAHNAEGDLPWDGSRRLQSHLIGGRFRIDDARVAAGWLC